MSEIQKFTAECNVYGGGSTQVSLYIGNPKDGNHPFENQNKWLGSRGIQIPGYIMDSFLEISKLAEKNNVDVTELSKYVIEEVESMKKMKEDIAKSTEIADSNKLSSETKIDNNIINNNLDTQNQSALDNHNSINNLNSINNNVVESKNPMQEDAKRSLFEKTKKS